MDASNEFRFISSPFGFSASKTTSKSTSKCQRSDYERTTECSENMRNVPVCVENSNRNVKLRFVWDKAFKLFQSHKTVYRAMSGITYNDYGTSVVEKKGRGQSGQSGSDGVVGRSQSQSDLSGGVDMSGRGHCEACGDSACRDFDSENVGKRNSVRRIHKTQEQNSLSTSGGEKPKKGDGDGEQHQQSYHLPSSSCSRTCGDGNGTFGSDKRMNYNCGCKCRGGGGRKNHHHHRLIPFHQSVQLRRSQSQKTTRPLNSTNAECDSRDNVIGLKTPRRRTIGQVEDLQRRCVGSKRGFGEERSDVTPIYVNINVSEQTLSLEDKLKEHLNGNLKAPHRNSYSPDSLYSQDDSGLDTWKSPGQESCCGGDSIVCTISSQRGRGVDDVRRSVSMRMPDTQEVNDPCGNNFLGTNTSVIQIENIVDRAEEAIGSECELEVDVECMSEIDLNSSDTAESVIEEDVTDLKMKFLTTGQSQHQLAFPRPPSVLFHENELDSLDLTLFETRRRGRGNLELQTLQELEAALRMDEEYACESEANFYDSASMGRSFGRPIYANVGDGGSNWDWSDAGSEFEFMGPLQPPPPQPPPLPTSNTNRDIPLGHSSSGHPPDVDWEPYFCVLNQLDQTFTSYRSEEMSIFPGTPTRPRSTCVFGGDGISPTDVVRIRLDGGPNSVKCLINNSKWGMNPVLEEEEENTNTVTTMLSAIEKEGSRRGGNSSGDYSSASSNQRNSSPASTIHDSSYDKACGNDRRSSAPLTPLLGREPSSRFANFFSKRSFKSNPLKRTKSVTKLERKKLPGNDSESNIHPLRLRTSRSHESLLTWTNHSVHSFVANGMMSTLDLTAGDVTVRPLHPSILGQDFGFQLITQSGGSKYYSCSSLAERDAWVQSLSQAIKPYSDEIRRLENSLKIWVLEGKGLSNGKQSTTKRYFCELYLDETLYARTSSKPKGEMLFWGEHFEFTQLPNCIQLITIVFFREGDKKRKKERNTCIGKVKIPMSTVNSRYLIEKWYPVIHDANPSLNSKEKEKEKESKDGPSIRIKCKFQSVDILPLRCYKPFLQYVKDEYGPVCECLENVLGVKAKEDLASAMVHVLHHENLAKEFITELALQEILKSGDEKLTFRGNSIATKAMEAFLKLTGSEYLHATLGTYIEDFQNSEDVFDCEIDPMKLSSCSSLTKNQQNLRSAVDSIWKSILHSHTNFPVELRECFAHCRQALKSAGRDELGDHLISASIFLRLLCPAILSPSLFNITNEYPTEKSARNLTLVAKVLQTLANFTRFQGKEVYMEFLNDFVESEAENMKNFLAMISSPLEETSEAEKRSSGESQSEKPGSAGGFIDLGKYSSILATLLSESVGKMVPKTERFKKLEELLETINLWLKQPHNATNVAVFPFPHLATPPPNVPPPPAPYSQKPPHRSSTPIINQSGSHQYQIPSHSPNAITTPVYAVTNVNPNVKNISQVQLMNGVSAGLPLHLQIPHGAIPSSTHVILHNQRSGSQASSGYQSQSPVLEGEKSKNSSPQMSSGGKSSLEAEGGKPVTSWTERKDGSGSNGNAGQVATPLSFSNPGFTNRKPGSQSADDLSSLGVEGSGGGVLREENALKKRLTRSSSSSDCEYASSTIASTKVKSRSSKPNGKKGGKSNGVHHNRLSRRSSAELLRKNHPYSSSTDEDSDSGLVNDKDLESIPQLPPRRSHGNKGLRYGPIGEKTLEEVRHTSPLDSFGINPVEYEREMVELRRAMEALQVKLNRAEERLFGHEQASSPRHEQSRRESDGSHSHSPLLSQYVHQSPNESRSNRNSHVDEKEMEQLLQRFLSAEEEMKREQELLSVLDKKQKLIEAQEQKISRLDAVNNQLLSALSQIRDSLQQQHVQQQQMKIQQQLQKQQQHLQSLSSSLMIPAQGIGNNNRNSSHFRATNNYLNNNMMMADIEVIGPAERQCRLHPSPLNSLSPQMSRNSNNNNTTKILITSDHHSTESSSGSVSPDSLDNHHHLSSNRDSSAILGEQALQMLAELKSSSC